MSAKDNKQTVPPAGKTRRYVAKRKPKPPVWQSSPNFWLYVVIGLVGLGIVITILALVLSGPANGGDSGPKGVEVVYVDNLVEKRDRAVQLKNMLDIRTELVDVYSEMLGRGQTLKEYPSFQAAFEVIRDGRERLGTDESNAATKTVLANGLPQLERFVSELGLNEEAPASDQLLKRKLGKIVDFVK